MTPRKDYKNRKAVRHAYSRVVNSEAEWVMGELEAVNSKNPRQADPIVEHLKQCPEAFKAGEMIGKMLDSLKYKQDNDSAGDRFLPPAGVVIPPLV